MHNYTVNLVPRDWPREETRPIFSEVVFRIHLTMVYNMNLVIAQDIQLVQIGMLFHKNMQMISLFQASHIS